jgi:hypothetical protein
VVRIFGSLAAFALLALAIALVLGFYVSGTGAAQNAELRSTFRVHFLVGVLSSIVVILVNSIAMTYFIGTSRWCKEVSDTYELPSRHVQTSIQLKRSAFPWALASTLIVIGVIVLGGAADTRPNAAANWAVWHLIGALAGVAFIAFSFFIQAQRIAAHHAVIEAIVAEVRKIRQERGLEV